MQQSFKSEAHNLFTEEVNKIALNANNDKSMESSDCEETFAYGIISIILHRYEKL